MLDILTIYQPFIFALGAPDCMKILKTLFWLVRYEIITDPSRPLWYNVRDGKLGIEI